MNLCFPFASRSFVSLHTGKGGANQLPADAVSLNTFILLWGARPPLGWGGVGAAGTEDPKSLYGSWCPATEVICFCSPNYFLESTVGVTHWGAVVGSCGPSTCDLSSRLNSSSFPRHLSQPGTRKPGRRYPQPLPRRRTLSLLLGLWFPAFLGVL